MRSGVLRGAAKTSFMSYTIRVLNEGDVESYLRLRGEALESEPQAFGETAEEHRARRLDTVIERLRASDGERFVLGAFVDRELVGMVGFTRECQLKRRHKGELWGMYVTAPQRGKSIGRALLLELLARVGSIQDLAQVTLSVTQEGPQRLYESLGFKTFGCEPDAQRMGKESVDETYMYLRLD